MDKKFVVFGKMLLKLRTDKGLTQKQLADKLKLHPQFVSNWERGLCSPPQHCLKTLKKILKLNQDDQKNLYKAIRADQEIQVYNDYKDLLI